jgi:hypothetical protein
VIRGQQYVTEVAVGEDVKLVEKETWRSVNVFWTCNNKNRARKNHLWETF